MVTGARLMARDLAARGVRVVFSLSGNQVLSLYEALDREGIRIVHTRHEGAAVHMADAWARLTGEVGVCLVTAGPGHANAMGALAMAESGESPVVLVSGHAPVEGGADADGGRAKAGSFQAMDQVGLARPITRWAGVATEAAHLPGLIETAFARARAGRAGPVSLSVPVNVLEVEMQAGTGIASTGASTGASTSASTGAGSGAGAGALKTSGHAQQSGGVGGQFVPEDDGYRAIVARLREGERPLILAGPAARRPRLRVALGALCAQTQLPLIVMDHPRGLTDPALGQVAGALGRADAVLLFGRTQDYRIGYGAAMAADCAVLQIDPVAEEIGRYRAPEIGMVAELEPAAAGLLDAARSMDEGPWRATAWSEEVRKHVEATATVPASETSDTVDGMHPWRVLDELAAVLEERERDGKRVCLVIDGGEFGQWARARLAARIRSDAGRHLVNEPSGAIGYAVPFAIAAKLARPDMTVVALAGDGAFGFYAMELETAARAGAPVLAVVGNDGAWGTERHLQRARYGPERTVATELLPARYELLAEGVGGCGERVAESGGLRAALERAFEAVDGGRVAVVNARIGSVASPAGAPP